MNNGNAVPIQLLQSFVSFLFSWLCLPFFFVMCHFLPLNVINYVVIIVVMVIRQLQLGTPTSIPFLNWTPRAEKQIRAAHQTHQFMTILDSRLSIDVLSLPPSIHQNFGLSLGLRPLTWTYITLSQISYHSSSPWVQTTSNNAWKSVFPNRSSVQADYYSDSFINIYIKVTQLS